MAEVPDDLKPAVQDAPLRSNSHLFGFDERPRILSATVSDAEVTRSWSSADDMGHRSESEGGKAAVVERIRGTAMLDKDAIEVIGVPQTRTNRLSFSLLSRPDDHSAADDWQRWKSHWYVNGDPLHNAALRYNDEDGARLLKALRFHYARLEERPPTCDIGFTNADWEIGNKDEWFFECRISASAFDQLKIDLVAGRVARIKCFATLVPTLADDPYAPPSEPLILGVLRLGKFDSGSCKGWVDSLQWELLRPASSAQSPEIISSMGDDDREPKHVRSEEASPNAEIQSLARAVRRGFIALFLLLALMIVFR